MLKPSSLGGVGVFATHDIPKGTHLFKTKYELRTLLIKDVPEPWLKYCIYINDKECLCPERFDRIEVGWFINHSSTPNIARKNVITDVESFKERTLYAIQDIKAGDEIYIDYNSLNEPESLKEDYYKVSNGKH